MLIDTSLLADKMGDKSQLEKLKTNIYSGKSEVGFTGATSDSNISGTTGHTGVRRRRLVGILEDTCRSFISGITSTKIIDIDESSTSLEVEPLNPLTTDEEAETEDLELLENNFQLKDEIAVGGQGRILKAYDKTLCRTIAVKSLRDELKDKLEHRKAFISEAKVTAQLNHPSIVPVYGLYEDSDNGLHLTMKLVRGKTLKEYLSRTRIHCRQLNYYQCTRYENTMIWKRLEIFKRVCEAISYAHHRQVIHRDLKPENIMIGSFNETYVMDWGIAEFQVGGERSRVTNKLAGTLQYIAPEVINKKPYGPHSDIFLLGLILYEIVFLKQAYSTSKSKEEAVRKAKYCEVESFEHRFHCKVKYELKIIIAKALAADPQKRYQSVKELLQDIHNFEIGEAISVAQDNWLIKTFRKLRHHYKLLMILSCIMIALMTTLISIALYREIQHANTARIRDIALAEIYSNGVQSCTVFDLQFKNYQFLLNSIAAEASMLLEGIPKNMKYDIYTFQDGLSGKKLPKDFSYAPVYRKPLAFSCLLYILPRDGKTPMSELERYIKQLYPLQRSFYMALDGSLREIAARPLNEANIYEVFKRDHKPPLLVAYIGLKNGLHVAYPYEVDYPEDYDPRQRGWYSDALKAPDKAVWGMPYIDIGEVQDIVITCSRVIYENRKEIVGVAAADVSLNQLIEMLSRTGNVGDHVKNKLLIDQRGRIIGDCENDLTAMVTDGELKFSLFDNLEFLPVMKKQKNGWFFNMENGINMLYFFQEVRTLNWIYVERIDFDELLRSKSSKLNKK